MCIFIFCCVNLVRDKTAFSTPNPNVQLRFACLAHRFGASTSTSTSALFIDTPHGTITVLHPTIPSVSHACLHARPTPASSGPIGAAVSKSRRLNLSFIPPLIVSCHHLVLGVGAYAFLYGRFQPSLPKPAPCGLQFTPCTGPAPPQLSPFWFMGANETRSFEDLKRSSSVNPSQPCCCQHVPSPESVRRWKYQGRGTSSTSP